MVTLARGNLSAGVQTIHGRMQAFRRKGKRYHLMTFQYLLGKVYFEMAVQRRPMRYRMILKNLPFLIRHFPFASRKAELNFKQALAEAESIGAKGVAGQIYFDMAQLYEARGKRDLAKASSDRCIAIFQTCGADAYLGKARAFVSERGMQK